MTPPQDRLSARHRAGGRRAGPRRGGARRSARRPPSASSASPTTSTAVTQLGPDPGPEHGVVVDQEDPRTAGLGSSDRWPDGAWTARPRRRWPGAERMTADPPKRAMRARIDWAMPWRSVGYGVGVEAPAPVPDEERDPVRPPPRRRARPGGHPTTWPRSPWPHRAASSRARSPSSSRQSPTTTTWTVMPWSASTWRWSRPMPSASVVASSPMVPGGRPSNSHDRSSRSWARARRTDVAGGRRPTAG